MKPLPFNKWPLADRTMWDRLVAHADFLDEPGPGAHWKPVTRMDLIIGYGHWLAYLIDDGLDLESEAPTARLTPSRVAHYIRSLTQVAYSTKAARIRTLSVLMPRSDPSSDWEWLLKMRRPLDACERRYRGVKKRPRMVASHLLLEAGLGLMARAKHQTKWSARKRAIVFRDGLAIALLASRPLRRKNFAGLRLGHHMQVAPFGYRIDIPAEETKTGVPIETVLPDTLLPWFKEYLEVHRPVLLGGKLSDYVWIMYRGRPYSPKHLGERITALTEKLVGKRVNPHLFRDCAATTIATVDPEHVRMIASLLGHSTPDTAERYYNQARSMEAGRAHQDNMLLLRARQRAKG